MDTAVIDEPTKLKLRPSMGLADRDMAWLQVTVKNKKGQMISNVHAKLAALVITPDEHRILYCECVATSSSAAHAIMGAISEADSTVQNWAYCPDKSGGYNIYPSDGMRVSDVKLALKGHSGLHHFALLSRAENFILANGDEQLWNKLRAKMSCPTKAEWGTALLPKILSSDLLLECESFGLPAGLKVYILQLDAEEQFDRIVGQHVRENGL